MSLYAVTVEYYARSWGDEPRFHECEIEASDVHAAIDCAWEQVEGLGIASEIMRGSATPIVEDTPAENDAKIKALCAKLRASLAARGAQ